MSTPTTIEDRPTKRICPSFICVILRKVSRQTPGARKGSTPSRMSMRASAMRNIAPVLTGSFPSWGAALRVLQVAEEIRVRLEQQQVVLAAETRAVGLHAAVERVELRVLRE